MRPSAVVTGAADGEGRALVLALAERGCAVVVVYLADQAAADAVVEEAFARGGTALALRADLTDEFDLERLFGESTRALGGVDVVAHASDRGTGLVMAHAARRLRDGGAIFSLARWTGMLAAELRARGITVNGRPAGLEPAGPPHDVATVLAMFDRWHATR